MSFGLRGYVSQTQYKHSSAVSTGIQRGSSVRRRVTSFDFRELASFPLESNFD